MKLSRFLPVCSSLALLAASAWSGDVGTADDVAGAQSAVFTGPRVPGLVLGLQHNQNQGAAGAVMYSAFESEATLRHGGDPRCLAPSQVRMVVAARRGRRSRGSAHGSGVVVAIKHDANQASVAITAFGRSAVNGTDFPVFRRTLREGFGLDKSGSGEG